ncbi:hypothetical protein AAFN46_02295 [Pseudomonas sp. CAU 1711]|uniref:hypothetical protein n=1 Tax=Pseudomonas sp. CAU 1711 TaxID=3140356 RepID=UPI003261224E
MRLQRPQTGNAKRPSRGQAVALKRAGKDAGRCIGDQSQEHFALSGEKGGEAGASALGTRMICLANLNGEQRSAPSRSGPMAASSRALVLAFGLAMAMLAVTTLMTALTLPHQAEVTLRQEQVVISQHLQSSDGELIRRK